MSVKNRIIRSSADNLYYPQFKQGLFGGWKFYAKSADTEQVMMIMWMETKDSAKAARFLNETDARNFVGRVMANSKRYWEEHERAKRRKGEGVPIDKIIPLNGD